MGPNDPLGKIRDHGGATTRVKPAPLWHIRPVDIAAKLQLRPDQRVAVIGLPGDLHLPLPVSADADPRSADAVIVFVSCAADLRARGRAAIEAARRNAIAWVAYPKAGALGTDLNRDALAALLMEAGIQPVRQVAIDSVWSALRFRPAR
jgi:hypothetical protein